MSDYEGSVVIGRDPKDVWAYVSDLGRTPEWRTSVKSVDPPGALAPGASFDARTRVVGRTWHWRLVLDEVDPPTTLTYSVAEGFTDITVTYRVEPDGTGTRFTLVARSEARRLFERLLEPIAGRALRRESERHLANLKAALEDGVSE
ncbi:MAG: SRPBCC family protein [Ilumatobacteraceae bacterium]